MRRLTESQGYNQRRAASCAWSALFYGAVTLGMISATGAAIHLTDGIPRVFFVVLFGLLAVFTGLGMLVCGNEALAARRRAK